MRCNFYLPRLPLLVATIMAFVAMTSAAYGAEPETVLYYFTGGNNGIGSSQLIMDAAGNLYGTELGPTPGARCGLYCGGVFELSPSGTTWVKATLYQFKGGNDGSEPAAALVFDKKGRLYGTTFAGGGQNGDGTVFELEHTDTGWREQVIHRFNTSGDGGWPEAALVFDSLGNLYGTTSTGGSSGGGTVFELSPSAGGWTETILHNFGAPGDGDSLWSGVVLDGAGNIYGTTENGGTSSVCEFSFGCGIVFELSPSSGGTWTETVLHSFDGSPSQLSYDGVGPETTPIFDSLGNLFGTTTYGGNVQYCVSGCGVVYELSPNADGTWTDNNIYEFAGGATDGGLPGGNIVMDAAGNIYGTTTIGGGGGSTFSKQCFYAEGPYCGTVYELSPVGDGWSEHILSSFDYTNGNSPSGVIMGTGQMLYGSAGGGKKYGVIYSVTE